MRKRSGLTIPIAGNALDNRKASVSQLGETDAFYYSVVAASVFSLVVSALVFGFAPWLMRVFFSADQTEILSIGVQYLRIEGACYVGIGLLFLLYGLYRGVGWPSMSLVLTIVSLGTRVVMSYMLAPSLGYTIIWWSIPLGWLLADAVGFGVWKQRKPLQTD